MDSGAITYVQQVWAKYFLSRVSES